jgi:CheY-like chemotaxis protein
MTSLGVAVSLEPDTPRAETAAASAAVVTLGTECEKQLSSGCVHAMVSSRCQSIFSSPWQSSIVRTTKGGSVVAILLVDDDDSTGLLLHMILSDSGLWRIERTTRGRDALTSIVASPPDLLVVDLHLPDIDGVSLIQEARSCGYGGAVMVLSGSSQADPLVQRLRTDLQGVEFLQKPFDLDDIVRRVAALLPSAPATPESTAQAG